MANKLTFSTFPADHPIDDNAIPIVLLHGWGLNSNVWLPFLKLFSEQNNANFQLITIDLPGFGDNSTVNIEPYDLTNICYYIEQTIDKPAIYLGWSLGGLIATQMAINHPNKVLALITVASSPYFVEESINNWPGIKTTVLDNFHNQLSQDTEKTIRGFLKIQAMGSPHIRQDLKKITTLVMAQNLPSQKTLSDSLTLLSQCDLRQSLLSIKQPFLRLYGQNDSLVPKGAIKIINLLAPQSDDYLFSKASHAPFISHLEDFYHVFKRWLSSNINTDKSKPVV